MDYLFNEIAEAITIIFSGNREFLIITWTSVKISLTSTFLASAAGIPFGVLVAVNQFPGKQLLSIVLKSLMSLPTVVVGLCVYSFLSRRGPLGEWGILFTPTAIIIGQFILIFPIISALTVSTVQGLDSRIWTTAITLGANRMQCLRIFLIEARTSIIAVVLAGFGRVFAEVGVSMMLGGNIRTYTRTITTTIALETNKGEFALGIALGIILLLVAFGVNIVFHRFQNLRVR